MLKFNITGPLAQLDRASDFESEGREFESLRGHQYKQRLSLYELDHVCFLGSIWIPKDKIFYFNYAI